MIKAIENNKTVFIILLLLVAFIPFEKIAFWDWPDVKLLTGLLNRIQMFS